MCIAIHSPRFGGNVLEKILVMLPVIGGAVTAWSRGAMKKTSRHRITPPGTRTTHDDGRSPGLQVRIVHLTFPALDQWC